MLLCTIILLIVHLLRAAHWRREFPCARILTQPPQDYFNTSHSVYNPSPQSLEYLSQSAIRTPTHTLEYNNPHTKWKLQKKQWIVTLNTIFWSGGLSIHCHTEKNRQELEAFSWQGSTVSVLENKSACRPFVYLIILVPRCMGRLC
jgi:hypothetical protein